MAIEADDPLILETLKRYAARHTIPLQRFLDERRVSHEGTGTLFTIAGRAFVISAAHIFEDVELEDIVTAPRPAGGKAIPLSPYILYRPNEIDKYDIAVLELTDQATVHALQSGWSFLTLDDVALPRAFGGVFALCGYPQENVQVRGDGVALSLIAAFTERMRNMPPNTKFAADPAVDMFFFYDEEATDTDGQNISTPGLRGVSGASVWEYTHEVPGVWDASKTLKVVGVQASFLEGDWFRCTTWPVVLTALRQVDSQLECAVAEAIARLDRPGG